MMRLVMRMISWWWWWWQRWWCLWWWSSSSSLSKRWTKAWSGGCVWKINTTHQDTLYYSSVSLVYHCIVVFVVYHSKYSPNTYQDTLYSIVSFFLSVVHHSKYTPLHLSSALQCSCCMCCIFLGDLFNLSFLSPRLFVYCSLCFNCQCMLYAEIW